MSSPFTSYRVVLPQPWVRIPVNGEDTEVRVRALVAEATADVPKEVPPDQVGPRRRQLERRLLDDVVKAREYGGVDLYVPTSTWHGFLLGASFVVSVVTADTAADSQQAVDGVLAELARGADSAPVLIGPSTWVRSEEVVAPDLERAPGADVPTRRVRYVVPLPQDARRWVVVAFSCVGDGDPDSELTTLSVELFDAIMGTWRWLEPTPPPDPA